MDIPGSPLDILLRHEPFASMGKMALDALACACKIEHFRTGDQICAAGDPALKAYIALDAVFESKPGPEIRPSRCGAGAIFPVLEFAAQAPYACDWKCASGGSALCLPFPAFRQALAGSPEFALHCFRLAADYARRAGAELSEACSAKAIETHAMHAQLGKFAKRDAPVASPGDPVEKVMAEMAAKRKRYAVIVDSAGFPLGIFTQSDALRRVTVPGYSQSAPVREYMTNAPATLFDRETAHDALVAMACHGCRQMVVTDADGKFFGVVSEHDLLALQRVSLRNVKKEIEFARDHSALVQAAKDIRALASGMLSQGAGSEKLTALVSQLNDALVRKAISFSLKTHPQAAAVPFAWICFGSEAREEQTLRTDQDNGIVFQSQNPDLDRPALLAFASDVCHALDDCGFELCKGGVMAKNPGLCLSLEEWKEKLRSAALNPNPQALVDSAIYFDLRHVYGRESLTKSLCASAFPAAAQSPMLLRAMAAAACDIEPPLGGLIRDFAFEDKTEKESRSFDLKLKGSRIFVDAARIMALANGIEEPATAARLRSLARIGKINPQEAYAALDAFHFIQVLRLRLQNSGAKNGGENKIQPHTLTEFDRTLLKEAFKQAKKLQAKLAIDYRL